MILGMSAAAPERVLTPSVAIRSRKSLVVRTCLERRLDGLGVHHLLQSTFVAKDERRTLYLQELLLLEIRK